MTINGFAKSWTSKVSFFSCEYFFVVVLRVVIITRRAGCYCFGSVPKGKKSNRFFADGGCRRHENDEP